MTHNLTPLQQDMLLVDDGYAKIESYLNHFGGEGLGMGEKARSIGLPDDVNRHLKQIAFLRNRVVHDRQELTSQERRRFNFALEEALEGLEDLKSSGWDPFEEEEVYVAPPTPNPTTAQSYARAPISISRDPVRPRVSPVEVIRKIIRLPLTVCEAIYENITLIGILILLGFWIASIFTMIITLMGIHDSDLLLGALLVSLFAIPLSLWLFVLASVSLDEDRRKMDDEPVRRFKWTMTFIYVASWCIAVHWVLVNF